MDVESDDGEDRSGGKSSSLRYPYKDDQWSPVNPSGKKVYDRNFLVELKNNPASMKKPEGLPGSWILQVIREKVRNSHKISVCYSNATHLFYK